MVRISAEGQSMTNQRAVPIAYIVIAALLLVARIVTSL
jgi:hypothetical protein